MIFKIITLFFILVVSIFFSACNSSSSSSNSKTSYTKPPLLTSYLKKNNLKLIIPLYVYPSKKNKDWKKLIDYKNVNPNIDMVVISSNGGNFKKVSKPYLNIIKDMNSSNIRVIGYVYTNYGKRDINDVEKDIDSWTQFYKDAGVSGIFFDQASSKNEKKLIDYYKELYTYTKSKGYNFIVLNAGTTVDNAYIDNNVADMVVSYEKPAQQLFTANDKRWTTKGQHTSLGMLVYSLEDKDLKKAEDIALKHHFKYIYFLNKDHPNPDHRWGALSKYLSLEIPYSDNNFTTILQKSTLETPEGNYSNLKGIANRYFYLKNGEMNIKDSILNFKDKFTLRLNTKKELDIILKAISSQDTHKFTFINLLDKDNNSSLLQVIDEENNLKIIFNRNSTNLGKITNNSFKVKIYINKNRLTFLYNNNKKILDAKDISSWDDKSLYFQIGTKTNSGCGDIAISKISY